jgi:mono/diheme cytochrome c family protein
LKALWTLEGLGVLASETVAKTMENVSPKLRAAGVRLSEPFLAANDAALTERAMQHATDPSREVRLQLALSLGEAPVATRFVGLAILLRNEPEASFLTSAAVSGLAGQELAFIEHLLAAPDWRESRAGLAEVFQAIAGAIGQSGKPEPLNKLLQIAQRNAAPKWQRLALLNGVRASGLRTVDTLPAALESAIKSTEPEVARAANELKGRLVWPGKFGSTPPPLTAAEKQLLEKGQVAYTTICAQCHQPDGRGREGVAAPLIDSPWVLGSDQFLARIVLKGKTGKTSVTMPPLEMLSNETLAGALTYIRRSWGHLAAPVSVSTISQMREQVILRSQPYTEAELQALRDGK